MIQQLFYKLSKSVAVVSILSGIGVIIFFDVHGEVAMDNFSFVANFIGIGLIAISITSAVLAMKMRNLIAINRCIQEMNGELERDPPFTRINPC